MATDRLSLGQTLSCEEEEEEEVEDSRRRTPVQVGPTAMTALPMRQNAHAVGVGAQAIVIMALPRFEAHPASYPIEADASPPRSVA
jgi:hypothetical protein